MYSEQGFDALIRAVFGHVCQSLTVVSNCIPGSPQTWVPSATARMRSRARCVSTTRRSADTARVCHSPSSSTARMNASGTRRLLFEFWKKTDA